MKLRTIQYHFIFCLVTAVTLSPMLSYSQDLSPTPLVPEGQSFSALREFVAPQCEAETLVSDPPFLISGLRNGPAEDDAGKIPDGPGATAAVTENLYIPTQKKTD